jgi:hypothetical protein
MSQDDENIHHIFLIISCKSCPCLQPEGMLFLRAECAVIQADSKQAAGFKWFSKLSSMVHIRFCKQIEYINPLCNI